MGNETVVWWQIYSSSSYLFVQLGYYLAAYSSVLMSKIITLWQSLFKLQCIMLWLLFKTQCIKKMLYVNLRNLFPIPPSTPRHRAASIRAHPHQFTSIAGACFAASRRTVISCNCGWPQWLDLLAPDWPLAADRRGQLGYYLAACLSTWRFRLCRFGNSTRLHSEWEGRTPTMHINGSASERIQSEGKKNVILIGQLDLFSWG